MSFPLNRRATQCRQSLRRYRSVGQGSAGKNCGLIDLSSRGEETVGMKQQMPEPQSASTVLLVRPAAFGFNAEAARSNVFSHASTDPDFASRAAAEFDSLARRVSDG